MGIDIARGTLRRMSAVRDQCLLRIVGADDPRAARAVLARLDAITAAVAPGEGSVHFVSEVIDTPQGPMVLLDAADLSDRELRQVLESLIRTADSLGLASGTLEVPPAGRRMAELAELRLAMVGSVLPPPDAATGEPPRLLPSAWYDVAAEWLRHGALEPVVAEVIDAEAEMDQASLRPYLHARTGAGFRVSSGSVATGLRTVVGMTGPHTRLAFLAGGLSWSRQRLAVEADEIRDHLRRCASEAAYAYVTPISRATRVGSGAYDVPGGPGRYPGGGGQALREFSDVMALDAFWWQMLGPGHLQRTGPIPAASALGHGKVELTLGELDEWLDEALRARPALVRAVPAAGSVPATPEPKPPQEELSPAHQRGRSILAPCFLTRQDTSALRHQRRGWSR